MGNQTSSESDNEPETGDLLALKNWKLDRIAWCTRPLKGGLASKLGGKHSLIVMAFASTVSNEEIGFSVEKDEKGLGFGPWLTEDNLKYSGGKIRETTSMFVKYRTLLDVLKVCSSQNQIKYDVSDANCHKFAKYLWDYCTNTPSHYNDKEPNKKLAKIAKKVKKSSDLKKKASKVLRFSMIHLDPYLNSDAEVIENIMILTFALS